MKKLFLAVLPLLFLLGGCAGGVPDDLSWTEVYADYSDDTRLYADSVNRVEPPSYIDGEWVRDPSLRVYRFDSRQELDAFRTKYDGELEFSQGRYDGDPFFDEVAGKYDDAYFDNNTLLIVYVVAGSGGDRFALDSVSEEQGRCVLYIRQTQTGSTADMSGRFILAELPADAAAKYSGFDAVMK